MNTERLKIKHNVKQHGTFDDYPPEKFSDLLRFVPFLFDIDNSLAVINKPANAPGHYYNCGSCAMAFDLRLKGYDVVARLKPDGTNVGDLTEYFVYYRPSIWPSRIYQPFATEYPDSVLHSYDIYTGYCEQLQARKRKKKQISGTRVFRKMQRSYDSYVNNIVCLRNEVIEKLYRLIKSRAYGICGIIILGFISSENPYERTTTFHAINYCGETLYDAQEGCICDLQKDNFDPREVMIIPTEGLSPKENVVELVANRR